MHTVATKRREEIETMHCNDTVAYAEKPTACHSERALCCKFVHDGLVQVRKSVCKGRPSSTNELSMTSDVALCKDRPHLESIKCTQLVLLSLVRYVVSSDDYREKHYAQSLFEASLHVIIEDSTTTTKGLPMYVKASAGTASAGQLSAQNFFQSLRNYSMRNPQIYYRYDSKYVRHIDVTLMTCHMCPVKNARYAACRGRS